MVVEATGVDDLDDVEALVSFWWFWTKEDDGEMDMEVWDDALGSCVSWLSDSAEAILAS